MANSFRIGDLDRSVAAVLLPSLAEPDDRTAVECGGASLSYRQLARACAAHLGRLHEVGLRQGDRVGVWTHPSLSTCVALVAHAAGGLVTVPLNPKLGKSELAH